MSMPKGKKVSVGYATVVDDDGANYRTISEHMTKLGQPMNHASARNHVLRIMKKFAIAFAEASGDLVDDDKVTSTARDPRFQSAMTELIQRQFSF